MAPTNLVDLDQLDPLPVSVRISGETFKVPGAPPLQWLWRFRQLEEQLGDTPDDLDLVAVVRDALADLIAIEQPAQRDAAIDALNKKGPAVVLVAIRAIYAGQAEPEADAVPPPKTTTKNGSSRSRAAKTAARSRSQSSRSSAR